MFSIKFEPYKSTFVQIESSFYQKAYCLMWETKKNQWKGYLTFFILVPQDGLFHIRCAKYQFTVDGFFWFFCFSDFILSLFFLLLDIITKFISCKPVYFNYLRFSCSCYVLLFSNYMRNNFQHIIMMNKYSMKIKALKFSFLHAFW